MKSNYVNSIRVGMITNPYFTTHPLGLNSLHFMGYELIPIGMNKTMFLLFVFVTVYIQEKKNIMKQNSGILVLYIFFLFFFCSRHCRKVYFLGGEYLWTFFFIYVKP